MSEMSTISREGHRHPLASSSASGAGGGIASLSPTPTPRSVRRQLPASSTRALHHTPPSPSSSAAVLPSSFTLSAANVSAALWALQNASTAASSVVGDETPASSTTIPRVAGITPLSTSATQPPVNSNMPNTTVTTSEDVLRGIYNEKLHASVRSIITTLSTELPEDHIFLQLLADPTTQQYCKVRLAEVVEGFLYSTQAEQYHELATELARREKDCEIQRRRIEELEAALALAVQEAQQQQQQHEEDKGGPHASHSPPLPPSHTSLPDVAGESPSSAPPFMRSPNPMDDEEARRELLRVLEQATHDQELSYCRQALHAATKVVAVTSAESKYEDKYLYEGELMEELYRCVQSLLQYVDTALDSQQRLRQEIQEQHPWMLLDREGEEGPSTKTTAATSNGNNGGDIVASDYSTPPRPRVSIGDAAVHDSSSIFHNAVSSHLSPISVSRRASSSSNSQQRSHGVDEIQQQRAKLRRLTQQLRTDQFTSRAVLEQLSQAQAQYRREVAQLQRAVEAAHHEATLAATTAEDAQHAKETLERQRAESVAAAAAERTELRDKLADVQALLAASTFDLQTARREVETLTAQLQEAEKREAVVLKELSAVKSTLLSKEALLREQQAVRTACQAELTELRAAHQTDVDALQDAARELLCLRVEKTMAGLNALYQDAKATKAEVLEREGYRYVCNTYSAAAAAQNEVTRHVQMQLQFAEKAQQEKAVTQQNVAEALGTLLRSMWADDATEAALASTSTHSHVSTNKDDRGTQQQQQQSSSVNTGTTTSRSSQHDGVDVEDGATGASTTAGRAQKYRLPTTLAGLCAALGRAYSDVRAHHHARQQTIESLRTTLIRREIELGAAQANEAQLHDLLKAERAKEEQWRAEIDQLSGNNVMRDLLERQVALLKAVSEERNALRRQWNSLSEDYIALEQRNGVLHARCAEKEHENARLSGMLRRSATSNGSTSLPAVTEAAASGETSKPPPLNISGGVKPRTARTQPALDKPKASQGSHLSFSAQQSLPSGSDDSGEVEDAA